MARKSQQDDMDMLPKTENKALVEKTKQKTNSERERGGEGAGAGRQTQRHRESEPEQKDSPGDCNIVLVSLKMFTKDQGTLP